MAKYSHDTGDKIRGSAKMTLPVGQNDRPPFAVFCFLCSYDCQYKINTHEKYAKKPHNGNKCRENLVEGGVSK